MRKRHVPAIWLAASVGARLLCLGSSVYRIFEDDHAAAVLSESRLGTLLRPLQVHEAAARK